MSVGIAPSKTIVTERLDWLLGAPAKSELGVLKGAQNKNEEKKSEMRKKGNFGTVTGRRSNQTELRPLVFSMLELSSPERSPFFWGEVEGLSTAPSETRCLGRVEGLRPHIGAVKYKEKCVSVQPRIFRKCAWQFLASTESKLR
jgi:hypothetical protein